MIIIYSSYNLKLFHFLIHIIEKKIERYTLIEKPQLASKTLPLFRRYSEILKVGFPDSLTNNLSINIHDI